MIVWLASYPRSGNTLTVVTLQDAFGIDKVGTVFDPVLRLGQPNAFGVETWKPPPELAALPNDELLEALRQRPEPFFIKTHRLAEVADPAPALVIVRDGRDALVSHAHYVKTFDIEQYGRMTYNQRLAALIHPGNRAFGTWSQSIERWLDRPGPLAVIRFEELIANPQEVVRGACSEVGVEIGPPGDFMRDFEGMNAVRPQLFRRGVVGSWRDEMPEHLHDRFWRVHGGAMERLGYHHQ